jgi:Flp pilus assembly protein TadD
MMISKRLLSLTLLTSSVLALSACQTTGPDKGLEGDKIDNALERAASDAQQQGNSGNSLSLLESRYKRNSSSPEAAIAYGKALRENEYHNRAAIVLMPFATDPEGPIAAKNEFAAVQLALGNYAEAEEYSKQVITAEPENYKAFHQLGIALEAQSMHPEAERAFRKGLDHWQGDPTPIMNNLALNLATQGFVDEAIEILQKAQTISPGRAEVERNLRIITTLKESNGPSRDPVKRDEPEPKKKSSS